MEDGIGLTYSPAVFQALVDDILRDFLNHFVFVYIDGILIFPLYFSRWKVWFP